VFSFHSFDISKTNNYITPQAQAEVNGALFGTKSVTVAEGHVPCLVMCDFFDD